MGVERRIAITGNNYQEGHLRLIARLMHLLRGAGFRIAVQRSFAQYLLSTGIDVGQIMDSVETLPADAELILSLGGDGTFLNTACWAAGADIPILGINTGHLGYLAAFSLDDMDTIVAVSSSRTYSPEARMTLRLRAPLPQGFYPYALNEVAILKDDTSSMINVRSRIDGRYLADYAADGLIFSTATGSTAYNLSAGGPLLQPSLDNIVISPVAPHSLTMRPLVVGGASRIAAMTNTRAGRYRVSVDGRSFTLPEGTEIEVGRARRRVKVVLPEGTDFASTLRHKLGWAL